MTPERIDLDALAALEDQKRFLLRSLRDLDAEYAADDIDEADYATLSADYTSRAAAIIRAIEDQHDLHEQSRPARPWARRLIALASVVVFAVAGGLVVAATAGDNGATRAGDDVDLQPSDEVLTCIDSMQAAFGPAARDAGDGDQLVSEASDAIKCFSARIDGHSDDAVAFTYRGWTVALLARRIDGAVGDSEVESLVQRANADLAEARDLAPNYPDALTFSAIMAVWTQDLDSAEEYLARIDALRLPADAPILAQVNQLLRPLISEARQASETSGETDSTSDSAPTTSATIPTESEELQP